MHLNIKEENELYLEFNKIKHIDDSMSMLENAYLYGPLLSNQVINISSDDSLVFDFSNQYRIISPHPNYFTAKLKWGKVEFIEDGKIIVLNDCILECNKVGILKALTEGNFFIIDVNGHTETTHHNNLTYKCYVLNEQGEPVD